jgi:hypothetical protein
MSTNLECLSIEDLEMILCIQCKKAARKAEVKRLVEEAAHKAEQAVAEEATQKAGEEAKDKARKVKRAVEVVGSRSDAELGPSQKKPKAKARAEDVESAEEFGDACQW